MKYRIGDVVYLRNDLTVNKKSAVKSGLFTKEDLKFGDIVTLRNGDSCIYTGLYRIRNNEDEYYSLCEYYDNFKHGIDNTPLDIMEIKRLKRIDYRFYYETLYERKEEILTKKEKEYLSVVIKPFRERVIYISLMDREIKEDKECWIYIRLEGGDYLNLPNFIKGKMYKRMKINRMYTLEELGL